MSQSLGYTVGLGVHSPPAQVQETDADSAASHAEARCSYRDIGYRYRMSRDILRFLVSYGLFTRANSLQSDMLEVSGYWK